MRLRSTSSSPSATPAVALGVDRCPRCQGGFECGVAGPGRCWCAKVSVSPQQRSELAASYEGCLCPACLRELEPKARASEAGGDASSSRSCSSSPAAVEALGTSIRR